MGEIQALISLRQSPFVIQCLGVAQSIGYAYVGLQMAVGGELLARMEQQGALSVESSRFYCAEVAVALHDVHKAGLVWRDLKPENVMLDETGHVKLVDMVGGWMYAATSLCVSSTRVVLPSWRGGEAVCLCGVGSTLLVRFFIFPGVLVC